MVIVILFREQRLPREPRVKHEAKGSALIQQIRTHAFTTTVPCPWYVRSSGGSPWYSSVTIRYSHVYAIYYSAINILINAHALLAVNSNYPFPINDHCKRTRRALYATYQWRQVMWESNWIWLDATRSCRRTTHRTIVHAVTRPLFPFWLRGVARETNT